MISPSGITYDAGEGDPVDACPTCPGALNDDGGCDRCDTVRCTCDALVPAAELLPLTCWGETLLACAACRGSHGGCACLVPQEREWCEHCGLPRATRHDGEMHVNDTWWGMVCTTADGYHIVSEDDGDVCSVEQARLDKIHRAYEARLDGGGQW